MAKIKARYHHTTLTTKNGPMQWFLNQVINLKVGILDFLARWKAETVRSGYKDATNGHYHHLALDRFSIRQLDNLIRYVLLPESHHNVARRALREIEKKAASEMREAVYDLSKLSLLLSERERNQAEIDPLNWKIIKRAKSLKKRVDHLDWFRAHEARRILKQEVENEFDHIKANDKSYTSVG